MRQLLRLVAAAAAIAATGIMVGLYFPEFRTTTNRLIVLVLFGLGLYELTRAAYALRPRGITPFETALAARERPSNRPKDLERLERSLGWGVYTRKEFDHRVRPLLLRLLGPHLRAEGVHPVRDPTAAAALVPDELAGLFDEPPVDDVERWADTRRIRALVAAIEELR